MTSEEIKMGRSTLKQTSEGHRVNITFSTAKPERIVESLNFVTPPTAETKNSKRKSQSSHS